MERTSNQNTYFNSFTNLKSPAAWTHHLHILARQKVWPNFWRSVGTWLANGQLSAQIGRPQRRMTERCRSLNLRNLHNFQMNEISFVNELNLTRQLKWITIWPFQAKFVLNVQLREWLHVTHHVTKIFGSGSIGFPSWNLSLESRSKHLAAQQASPNKEKGEWMKPNVVKRICGILFLLPRPIKFKKKMLVQTENCF